METFATTIGNIVIILTVIAAIVTAMAIFYNFKEKRKDDKRRKHWKDCNDHNAGGLRQAYYWISDGKRVPFGEFLMFVAKYLESKDPDYTFTGDSFRTEVDRIISETEREERIYRSKGAEAILTERTEHFTKHNRSINQDVKNNPNGELMFAAIKLVMGDFAPQNWDKEIWDKMQRKSIREKLIIAGSFFAAEIDRLDRQASIDKNEGKIETNNG